VEEHSTPARERALAWAGGNVRRWLPWVAVLVFFTIAVQTAPEVLDLEAVEEGLLPLVAAAAAFPFGLVLTRPLLGWLISAASALVCRRSFRSSTTTHGRGRPFTASCCSRCCSP
jgi:hypothetical protein